MTRAFATLVRCLLSALLILTGQQLASLPVGGHPVTEAVLCIGGGLLTVQLDADGNPVGPPHPCPDATLSFLPGVPAFRPSGGPRTARPAIWAAQTVTRLAARPVGKPPATGPPVPV